MLSQTATNPAARSFQSLCIGRTVQTSRLVSYKSSTFPRVVDQFLIEGGDTAEEDVIDGSPTHQGLMSHEDVPWRKIDQEGLVCTRSREDSMDSSQ